MKKNNIFTGSIIVAVIIAGLLFFTSQNHKTANSTSNQTTIAGGRMLAGFTGKVLAGNTSPYIIFNKADYTKALSSKKIIFLDFYANWCPICREEAPVLIDGFNNLTSDKIIGFRINWNDSETTDDDRAMASQFGIAQQHTKVILENGKEISRTLESWTKNDFLQQMNALGVQ
jgi:thiol-disulfide isomerase/thioredoxin